MRFDCNYFVIGIIHFGYSHLSCVGYWHTGCLNIADMPFIDASAEAFCGHELQLTAGNPVLYAGREYYVSQYYRKLIDVSNALIGWIKGSLAVVTVLASALFGAISGSGVATASAVGGTTIPAMKEEGYPDHFAAAISGIAAILGPIIPPSITLIVYASIGVVVSSCLSALSFPVS